MFVLYSSASCAPCRMTKALFERFHVKYEERDIADPKNLTESLRIAQRAIVPVVVNGDQVIIGHNPARLADLLRSHLA